MNIEEVLREMRPNNVMRESRRIEVWVLEKWTDAIEAAMREKDEAHRVAMRTCMEWRRKEKVEIEKLQDRLFSRGEMHKPPCFVCGYNGQNYYRPDIHPCAARHHALAGKEEN